MKTEVTMQRELMGGIIRQKSKSEMMSATDLVKIGNKYRAAKGKSPFNLSQWLTTPTTKEFIQELSAQFGDVIIKSRGRAGNTWVHPYLFIDIALSLNPGLKIKVYDWLYDHLLKYRNDSGDSYKKMCGALYLSCTNKREYPAFVAKAAKLIREACCVEDWQTATEDKLELRDRIHNNISLLTDVIKDANVAVEIGIQKALEG